MYRRVLSVCRADAHMNKGHDLISALALSTIKRGNNRSHRRYETLPEQASGSETCRAFESARSKQDEGLCKREERRELEMEVRGKTSRVKKSRQPLGKLQDLSNRVREDYGVACEPKEETIGRDWRQFRSSG